MPLHTLLVETNTWSPALETAGEIAITRAVEGLQTGFCFLDTPNPDDAPSIAALERTGLWRRSRKVGRLIRSLEGFGVEIISAPELDPGTLRRVEDFATAAPGGLEELRDYRYGEAALGEGAAASLLYLTRHARAQPADHRALVEECLRGAALAFEMTTRIAVTHQPQVIITYGGRLATPRAVAEAARATGVRVEYQECGSTFDKYEIYSAQSQSPGARQAAIRRFWEARGSNATEIAEAHFRRRGSGPMDRRTSFVDAQRAGELPPLSESLRQVVYFCSSDYEGEWAGRRTAHWLFPTQADAVRHLARWAAERSDVALTIRVHPRSRDVHARDLDWLRAIKGANVQVIGAASPVDTYALMKVADVVVTSGSTVGVEATFAERPSILLSEAFYRGLDCVHEPRTTEELDALLGNSSLEPKAYSSTLPVGYWLSEFGIPYRYYKARTCNSGVFLGHALLYDPGWATGILRLARAAWHRRPFRPHS